MWRNFTSLDVEKFTPHRVKCHKIVMIYPQPIHRHYHLNTHSLRLLSYLRILVVRAVHRHRTGVGSIPAGGPYTLSSTNISGDRALASRQSQLEHLKQ